MTFQSCAVCFALAPVTTASISRLMAWYCGRLRVVARAAAASAVWCGVSGVDRGVSWRAYRRAYRSAAQRVWGCHLSHLHPSCSSREGQPELLRRGGAVCDGVVAGWVEEAVSPLPCLLRVHVVRAVCGCLSCNSPCPLSRLSCAVWRPAVSVLSYLVPVVLTRPVLVIVSPLSPGHRSFNFSIDLSGHPAAVLASRGRGRGALARGACVQRSSTPTATSCQLQPRTSCFIRSHVVGSGNLRRAAMYNSSVTV